jgi:hypothetical protein
VAARGARAAGGEAADYRVPGHGRGFCIVDDTGKIVREVKVVSEPEALLAALKDPALSQWLFSALAEAELPVICVETRHMQAVLKTQINRQTATMRAASRR